MTWVILDRDGVINHDSDAYIKSPAEWQPIDGSLEAIGRLSNAGIPVVVITNQSGIARKLFDMDELNRIHAKMNDRVRTAGGHIDAIFFCPHHPDDGCDCRKPRSGLLREAARRLRLELRDAILIGDSPSDLQAAADAGTPAYLVRTGKGQRYLDAGLPRGLNPDKTFDDLADAVTHILDSRQPGR